MKARLFVGGVYTLAVTVLLLLSVCAVFVVHPESADRVADFLGQEKLSTLVRILY